MTGACYRETPVPTRSPTVTTSTATAATSIQTRRITRYLYKIHASFGAPARGVCEFHPLQETLVMSTIDKLVLHWLMMLLWWSGQGSLSARASLQALNVFVC